MDIRHEISLSKGTFDEGMLRLLESVLIGHDVKSMLDVWKSLVELMRRKSVNVTREVVGKTVEEMLLVVYFFVKRLRLLEIKSKVLSYHNNKRRVRMSKRSASLVHYRGGISSLRGSDCNIICMQPRRIFAISIVARISNERGENLGETFGYQIRLESKQSEQTRLLFYTTGVLLQNLGLSFHVQELFLEDVLEKTRYVVESEADNFQGYSKRRRRQQQECLA
ncbi:hypothetical protein CTI12_AA233470 [Artemisia annua]|uniref:RNA helicase n=1 Tax=Artemisia annua TaxID=35608 RepID=A0A2U1NSY1_ARTAN|nr:hypothetical protein CTI12_AA233470 [Artemisia annua]